MVDVYGDSITSYSTVARWSAESKRGRDITDDSMLGRPADVIIKVMIDRLKGLVNQSCQTCFRMWHFLWKRLHCNPWYLPGGYP